MGTRLAQKYSLAKLALQFVFERTKIQIVERWCSTARFLDGMMAVTDCED